MFAEPLTLSATRLVINQIQTDDAGNYSCIVGLNRATLFISVRGQQDIFVIIIIFLISAEW